MSYPSPRTVEVWQNITWDDLLAYEARLNEGDGTLIRADVRVNTARGFLGQAGAWMTDDQIVQMVQDELFNVLLNHNFPFVFTVGPDVVYPIWHKGNSIYILGQKGLGPLAVLAMVASVVIGLIGASIAVSVLIVGFHVARILWTAGQGVVESFQQARETLEQMPPVIAKTGEFLLNNAIVFGFIFVVLWAVTR
jgi:hypothetical protein